MHNVAFPNCKEWILTSEVALNIVLKPITLHLLPLGDGSVLANSLHSLLLRMTENVGEFCVVWRVVTTDLYEVPDAVPPIHAVSSHVATDKDPSKFRSIFSDNLQPIATHGKKAHGTLLVDIGCSSKRVPLSISYYNEVSSGHIGSCCC